MTNKEIKTYATIAGIILLVVIVGLIFKPKGDKQLELVYDVCSYSRGVQSGDWEEACGKAQDAARATYRCETHDTDSHCWVEKKSDAQVRKELVQKILEQAE
jgi:hypothetical protein